MFALYLGAFFIHEHVRWKIVGRFLILLIVPGTKNQLLEDETNDILFFVASGIPDTIFFFSSHLKLFTTLIKILLMTI